MTDKPHMKLPNGDTIYEGGFGRTRDGQKVGPIKFDLYSGHVCGIEGESLSIWHSHSGAMHRSKEMPGDIIAEWSDDPLPYGHVVVDGETVDLTAIEKPFGLLSEAVQKALLDHGGPYEYYRNDSCGVICWGCANRLPTEDSMNALAYRVRPKPEPERRTLTLYGRMDVFSADKIATDTLRITTTLTDGQWPLGTFINQDGQIIIVEEEE